MTNLSELKSVTYTTWYRVKRIQYRCQSWKHHTSL